MQNQVESRRGFLSFLTNALLAVLALCLLVPAFIYLCSPLWRRRGTAGAGEGFSDAGAVADLPAGKWQLVTVELVRQDGWETTRTRRAVWVRRSAEGEHDVTVLSPICPHLGCPIDWNPERSEFMCPCHKGAFDAAGKLVSGPPPRGMDVLESEVRAGRLLVRWQDFKIGVAESIPVQV
jgi:menaquinol-cytochrome c reductase iron-sulfur subunit